MSNISRNKIVAKRIKITKNKSQKCDRCENYITDDYMWKTNFAIKDLPHTKKQKEKDSRLEWEKWYCDNMCAHNQDQAIMQFRKDYDKWFQEEVKFYTMLLDPPWNYD